MDVESLMSELKLRPPKDSGSQKARRKMPQGVCVGLAVCCRN